MAPAYGGYGVTHSATEQPSLTKPDKAAARSPVVEPMVVEQADNSAGESDLWFFSIFKRIFLPSQTLSQAGEPATSEDDAHHVHEQTLPPPYAQKLPGGCLTQPCAEPILPHQPKPSPAHYVRARTATYHSSHWQYTDTSGLKVSIAHIISPPVAIICATSPTPPPSSTARHTLTRPGNKPLLTPPCLLDEPSSTSSPLADHHALPTSSTAQSDCYKSPIIRRNHWRQKPGRVYVSARGIRKARTEREPGRWWRQATARSRRHGSSHTMRSALLDRTNRNGREGVAQSSDGDHDTSEAVACSESSGSEAANEHVLESASSDSAPSVARTPSSSDSEPDRDRTMQLVDHFHRRYTSGRSWHFTQYGHRQFELRRQCFGDKGDVEDITEADIISTVEFDQTGNYLATGDKGGRVVLFERNETKKTCEYKFHTEFQSHEPEFDYLKSLEIEEKINKIKWCKRQNSSHYLLSTNDKTIKLWKVFEKSLKVVAENNLSSELTPAGASGANGGGPVRYPNQHFRSVADLKFPRMTHHDTVVAAVPRKVYANAHAYHINSISVNSDGETFISSDDLRINLWNLNIQDQSFNIVDIKPANMEELTEVITAAEFHPTSCNWFMYASSKGTIKLADMRQKALCDEHAKQFEQEEDPSSRSFFSEIISSISDVRFSHDGRYILSRDYLTVKIWDVNMERQPVKTIPIHEHLRPRLCDTYENDSIFDKFEVTFSGDAKNVMTGSYNNNFMIYPSDPDKDTEIVLQADKSAFKAKKVGIPTPMNAKDGKKGSRASSPAGGAQRMRKETDADQIDFNKKILHMSWHPHEDSIAIAATNNLFVFSAL
ncbi:hypothetical protein Q7P37_005865 [Cladosporium fusiforme]